MLWGLFVGSDGARLAWEATARAFADWPGLVARAQRRTLADGRTATLMALHRADEGHADTRPGTAAVGLAGDVWKVTDAGPEPDGVTLALDLRSGELSGSVPVAACEQLYHSFDGRGTAVGNDLRLMGLWAGRELDERGVYAQHQFGAVPPPLTLFHRVRRVPNGHAARLMTRTGEVTLTRRFPWPVDDGDAARKELSTRALVHLESEYWKRLRARLAEVPADAVLFFSGGVDSSILAALFRELSRDDVALYNLSFGEHDTEAAFALQIAASLDVRVRRVVTCQPCDLAPFLERLARDYSFPISDDSAIPANVLVHHTLAECIDAGHAVEGLGPDQIFGVRGSDRALRQALRIPRPARSLAGSAYGWFGCAERASKPGHILSRFRKSARLDPRFAFSIAANCLEGIAYHATPQARAEVDGVLGAYIESLADGWPAETRFAVLQQVHTAAGLIGMKLFEPLRRHGVHRHLPFMQEDLVRLGFEMSSRGDFDRSEAKGFIKRELARRVPPAMVYRRKRGFAAPFRGFVREASMQELIRDLVLSPENPARNTFDHRFVSRIAERSRKGEVSAHAYHFLWGLMFLSAWLWRQPAAGDLKHLDPAPEGS